MRPPDQHAGWPGPARRMRVGGVAWDAWPPVPACPSAGYGRRQAPIILKRLHFYSEFWSDPRDRRGATGSLARCQSHRFGVSWSSHASKSFAARVICAVLFLCVEFPAKAIEPAVGGASCSALIGWRLAATFSHHCAEYFGVIQGPRCGSNALAAAYTWQHYANSTLPTCTKAPADAGLSLVATAPVRCSVRPHMPVLNQWPHAACPDAVRQEALDTRANSSRENAKATSIAQTFCNGLYETPFVQLFFAWMMYRISGITDEPCPPSWRCWAGDPRGVDDPGRLGKSLSRRLRSGL